MVIALYNIMCLFYSYDERKYEQIHTGWVIARVNKGPRTAFERYIHSLFCIAQCTCASYIFSLQMKQTTLCYLRCN